MDESSSVVGQTKEDSLFRRVIGLVPVFILETHNQTNNECLPKFVQMDNVSSSIKMAASHSMFTLLVLNLAESNSHFTAFPTIFVT